jgi:NodT family efflux transporter outer membrane factor (OMF) lipoprotein
MIHRCRYLTLPVALLVAGCAVGPRYTPPVPQSPVVQEYKEGGNWKTAAPSDEIQKGKWWEIFKDAQLNSLEEQIDVSNQNLKAAHASFEQARALIRQNRSSLYPGANGGASITSIHQSDNRPLGHANYTDYMVPVNLSYEADVWGRVKYTIEGSRAAAQASAADLETVNLSMHAELASDYFELHGLDAEQQLLDSTVESYQKALDLTRNRFNGGIASQADVTKAETQLATTRAQAVDVGIQRSQFEHAIAVLVGKSASTFTLPPSPLTAEPPTIPTGLPSELLERRPGYSWDRAASRCSEHSDGRRTDCFLPRALTSSPCRIGKRKHCLMAYRAQRLVWTWAGGSCSAF